jgi:hypothetical protein
MNAQPKVTTPNPTPSALFLAHQESSAEKEAAVSPAFAKDTAVQIPPRGVEETRSHPRKSSPQQHSDPNSDPTTAAARTSVLDVHRLLPDGTSERVQQQVASLPAEVIAALWDMFRAQNRSPLQ